ncbi:hypothetical protein ANN_19498 [Periplaneta americana]|uniref:Uncharacterized protein n=1 Tax=Periplaneta americana TaxID=6978 RepID=A0ABQ8SAQ2_PERAM|nr:hypothetical protein ANN_19498 [Periplaneta americana]
MRAKFVLHNAPNSCPRKAQFKACSASRFLWSGAHFRQDRSFTSADVLGRPDRSATATFPEILNLWSNLPDVVCATGCRSTCLRLNSSATSL